MNDKKKKEKKSAVSSKVAKTRALEAEQYTRCYRHREMIDEQASKSDDRDNHTEYNVPLECGCVFRCYIYMDRGQVIIGIY